MPVSRYRPRRRTNTVRRRRYKRPTYSRRTRRPRITRAIGLPKQIFAKLRYSELNEINIAAGASSTVVYRLNSIFDPNASGVGGQPYYSDQYAAMYNRYRVYGCKVDVTMSCSSSTANLFHPTAVLLSYADTAPAWGTQINASNSKRCIRRQMIPGQSIVTMKRYFDLASVAGVSRREYNVAEVFQALTTANPSRNIDCQVNVENNDGTATISLTYTIRLTYYVKYFDNLEPAAS